MSDTEIDALADQIMLVLRSHRGPEIAREILRVAVGPAPGVSIEDASRAIIAATAIACGLRVDDIHARCRVPAIAEARMISMFLIRELTGAGYSEIGRMLGRDHTTVMSACARVGCRPKRMAARIDVARRLATQALEAGTDGARSLAQAPAV